MKTILSIGITIVMAIAGVVSYKFFGANNPVEEAAESVIQTETGDSINLNAVATEIGLRAPTGPTAAASSTAASGTTPAA